MPNTAENTIWKCGTCNFETRDMTERDSHYNTISHEHTGYTQCTRCKKENIFFKIKKTIAPNEIIKLICPECMEIIKKSEGVL